MEQIESTASIQGGVMRKTLCAIMSIVLALGMMPLPKQAYAAELVPATLEPATVDGPYALSFQMTSPSSTANQQKAPGDTVSAQGTSLSYTVDGAIPAQGSDGEMSYQLMYKPASSAEWAGLGEAVTAQRNEYNANKFKMQQVSAQVPDGIADGEYDVKLVATWVIDGTTIMADSPYSWKMTVANPQPVQYAITKGSEDATLGTFSVNKEEAEENEIVQVTVNPADGAEFDCLELDGEKLETAWSSAENVWKFYMPARDVTVTAVFKQSQPAAVTNFTIASEADYKVFRDAVNAGQTNADTVVTVTDDFSLTLGSKDLPAGIVDTTVGRLSVKQAFLGTFDGQGHTVTLNIGAMYELGGKTQQPAALIGVLGATGTVKNVIVKGQVKDRGTSSNSQVTGIAAGVVGILQGGTVENASNYATLNTTPSFSSGADQSVAGSGGIVGYGFGTVRHCANHGDVTTNSTWGAGVFGHCVGETVIDSCYNVGKVQSDSFKLSSYYWEIAGLANSAGQLSTAIDVKDSYNAGAVVSEASFLQATTYGLVDKTAGSIENAYYLDSLVAPKSGTGATAKSASDMESASFLSSLGSAYAASTIEGQKTPALTWEVQGAEAAVLEVALAPGTHQGNGTTDFEVEAGSGSSRTLYVQVQDAKKGDGAFVVDGRLADPWGSAGTRDDIAGFQMKWYKDAVADANLVEAQDLEWNEIMERPKWTTDFMYTPDDVRTAEPGVYTYYAVAEWSLEGFETVVSEPVAFTITVKQAMRAVSFDADGGAPAPETQTVGKGAAATEPAAPEKDGYRFLGWYDGDSAFDFATPIDEDVALKAHWAKLYGIEKADTENGSFKVTDGEGEIVQAAQGDTVVVAPEPAEGFEVESVSYQAKQSSSALADNEVLVEAQPAASLEAGASYLVVAEDAGSMWAMKADKAGKNSLLGTGASMAASESYQVVSFADSVAVTAHTWVAGGSEGAWTLSNGGKYVDCMYYGTQTDLGDYALNMMYGASGFESADSDYGEGALSYNTVDSVFRFSGTGANKVVARAYKIVEAQSAPVPAESVAVEAVDGAYRFAMPGYDVTVAVAFKQAEKTYKVTLINDPEHLKGISASQTEGLKEGDEVTVELEEQPGWYFTEIELTYADGTTKTVSRLQEPWSYTFAMPAQDVTVRAVPIEEAYLLYGEAAPEEGGSVQFVDGENLVDELKVSYRGGTFTAKVTENEDWVVDSVKLLDGDGEDATEFYDVSLAEGEGDGVYVITYGDDGSGYSYWPDEATFTVTFKQNAAPQPALYSIDYIEGEGGTLSVEPEDDVEPGTVVTVTATPDEGYELAKLTYTPEGGEATDITQARAFEMPAANVTVEATFVLKEAPQPALVKVAKPEASSFTYDGTAKVAVKASEGYELSGTTKATNAGSYQAIAKLEDGFVWADGSTAEVKLAWSIARTKVAKPEASSFTYDGTAKVAVKASEGYELSGTTKATNAGSYQATATLDANHMWADGSTKALSLAWKVKPASIAKAKLAKVAAVTYRGKAVKPAPKVTLADKVLAPGIDYKLSYRANAKPGKAKVVATGTGNYTGMASKSFTIKLAKPTVRTVGHFKAKKMTVNYTAVAGAEGYQVAYRKAGAKKWTVVSSGKALSYDVSKLKANGLYQFRAAALCDGKLGPWSTIKSRWIAKASGLSVKAGSKKLTVSWKTVAKADAYRVMYSKSKDMSHAKSLLVKSGKATKAAIKGLDAGATYYVSIRAIRSAGGKNYYGILPKTVSVKVK